MQTMYTVTPGVMLYRIFINSILLLILIFYDMSDIKTFFVLQVNCVSLSLSSRALSSLYVIQYNIEVGLASEIRVL